MITHTIITACSRPENLETIYQSILSETNTGFKVVWNIIHDSVPTPELLEIKNKLINWGDYFVINHYYHINSNSISGNAQRNTGISLADENSYVYFLDDDNILMPGFFNEVNVAIVNNPDKLIFIGDQILPNGTIRLFGSPDNTKVDHIDLAQYIVHSSIAHQAEFDLPHYNADGRYIEKLYNMYKDRTYFFKETICFYNYLRNE